MLLIMLVIFTIDYYYLRSEDGNLMTGGITFRSHLLMLITLIFVHLAFSFSCLSGLFSKLMLMLFALVQIAVSMFLYSIMYVNLIHHIGSSF